MYKRVRVREHIFLLRFLFSPLGYEITSNCLIDLAFLSNRHFTEEKRFHLFSPFVKGDKSPFIVFRNHVSAQGV